MKVTWTGLESSGKSLKLAMTAADIAHRNSKWREKTGIARPIVSNLRFSRQFEDYVRNELNVPIQYWSNVDELPHLTGVDLFVDELGRYFDSRMWKDLSPDVRGWLAQAAKLGVEMYSAAQDFSQVEITLRRLTNHLFVVTKLLGSSRPTNTRPAPKYIWGLCSIKQLDPTSYDENAKKFPSTSFPSFFMIERKYCEIFDTTQRFQRSAPLPFEHVTRNCTVCGFHKTAHI